MTNIIKTISYEDRVHIFWTLAAISLLSLFVYIYSINALARTVAERGHLEREVTELSSTLGTLEFSYIAKQNEITPEVARQYGFSEVKSPLYVARNASADALTFNAKTR